ncbi:MAG: hypothetical protein JEZ00_13630 [Anaerolineaceae bacterium]|nr:hypothetical protein [Anaerolineaceae bacterium]
MSTLIANIPEISGIVLWLACWFIGGYLLTINSFRVQRSDATLLGFGIGLVLQAWLSNIFGRFLAPEYAFWISSTLLLFLGILITIWKKNWMLAKANFYFKPSYWIVFFIITLVFFKVGRGLAIYDDYQNLPVVSYIASGQIPPGFVLNPGISFDYHYLMLIFSAQWIVIADMFPWTALDISRAITLAMLLSYVGIFTRRLTKSTLAGWISMFFVAFAGGTRWLMLYLPAPVLKYISDSVSMIGSGKSTADSLVLAMQTHWVIEGVGPIDFPFAFGNSIHGIPIMGHGGVGMLTLAIPILLMLLFGQWKNNFGKIVFAVLLAAMALIDEIWFGYFMATSGLMLLYLIFRKQTFYGDKAWKVLLFMFVPIGMVALVQGGVLSGVSKNILLSIFGTDVINAETSYFTASFPVRWPPAVISAHLGRLYLTNPGQLLAAIFEVGPIILAFPFVILWGRKGYKFKNWLYPILALGAIISLLTLFMEYEGSAGIAASVRLPNYCYTLCRIFAVPSLWYWLRNKTAAMRIAAVMLTFFTMVGGLFYFGIQSIAGQTPILSTFIEPMDAVMENRYWDQLPEDSMVFDPMPSRSATIFARPSESQSSWYSRTDEFNALTADPNPYQIHQAGYDYIYWSEESWHNLSDRERASFDDPCVIIVDEITQWDNDFRRLLDISTCQSQN